MNAKKFSDAMSELDTKYVDEAYMDKVGNYGSLSLPYNLRSYNSAFT